MKKSALLLLLVLSSLLKAQQEKKDALIVNFEGVYGLGAIYDEAKSGGIGFGAGVWLPFKEGYIELSLDLTSSASRNNGELQMLYNYPFNLIADSRVQINGYIGAGLVLGRIYNREKYFWNGVEDYNTGGVIGNVGLELKPNGSKSVFYLDAKTGIISVPGWASSVTTPFKISLGLRFLLDKNK
tara:strand:- start:644 stop:1195 length:552 start_codon:yes stop_codon:yes gene_type:complete